MRNTGPSYFRQLSFLEFRDRSRSADTATACPPRGHALMAHATSFDTDPSLEQRPDRVVVVGVDRSKQFRRARRHTILVRALRLLLPVSVVTSIGLYAASAIGTVDWSSSLTPLLPQILPENLSMQNPNYSGYTDDGGAYQVRARHARPNFEQPHVVDLEGISGVLTDAKKVKTTMAAANGVFNTRQNVLELTGGIKISSDDGMRAELETATIRTKSGQIVSEDPVEVGFKGGEVKSDTVKIWQKKKLVLFDGNVRTELTPPSDDDGAKPAPTTKKRETQSAFLGSSKEPVNIQSEQLKIERGAGKAEFVGKVNAVQGEQSLQTAQLIVDFEDAKSGGQKSSGSRIGGDASQINTIEAPKPVMMRRGETEQVTGQSALFDVKNDTAKIIGSVVISAGPERRAVADIAEINSKSDTILLQGNVIVSQGRNEIRGERLFVDRANGISKVSTPSGVNGKPGRIKARLQQDRPEPAKKKKAKAKDQARALAKSKAAKSGALLSMTGFKSEPGVPTVIESDVLNVNDKLKKAVFSGKVKVDQGRVSMRAQELTAFYSGDSSLLAPAEPKAAKKKGATGQVKRIRANGKVFVKSSTDGQTASGDWADFDVKNNTIKLGGDVVLNQGKNVIKAKSLKIDMETGNALIEHPPDQQGTTSWVSSLSKKGPKGTRTTPLQRTPGGSGRPSAVFYPMQFQKPESAKAKRRKTKAAKKTKKTPKPTVQQAPRPATSSSWEATAESFE